MFVVVGGGGGGFFVVVVVVVFVFLHLCNLTIDSSVCPSVLTAEYRSRA